MACKQVKKREVAGSFIFKLPQDWPGLETPKVALFRRSGKVSTYRHHYGPIAGSVEADDRDPLATAWRELQEETTLTSSSLELYRQGKPYSFVDEEIGREWTINPFSFRLKPPGEGGQGEAGITIDWEHEGWDWFDPFDVIEDTSFGVPRLTESLRRSWFEYDLGADIGGILSKGLAELKDDHESGARQLAGKALEIFVAVASQLPIDSAEQWWKQVRMVAWHLWKNGRESMGAATLNVMMSALEIAERKLPADITDTSLAPDFLRDMTSELQLYAEQRRQATLGIWQSFEEYLKSRIFGSPATTPNAVRILTLSSSSTIAACLERAIAEFHLPFDIRILESRPLFEGVSLATKLLANPPTQSFADGKTTVTLYTDASVAIAASEIDVLLIGADLLSPTGAVSNKVGSLPATLTAKHISPLAKILVVAEKEKVLPFPPPSHSEENDLGEVMDAWAKSEALSSSVGTIRQWSQRRSGTKRANNVPAVKNIYFEWVPPELVDDYVFDDGLRKASDLETLANELKARFHRLFDDI